MLLLCDSLDCCECICLCVCVWVFENVFLRLLVYGIRLCLRSVVLLLKVIVTSNRSGECVCICSSVRGSTKQRKVNKKKHDLCVNKKTKRKKTSLTKKKMIKLKLKKKKKKELRARFKCNTLLFSRLRLRSRRRRRGKTAFDFLHPRSISLALSLALFRSYSRVSVFLSYSRARAPCQEPKNAFFNSCFALPSSFF